jgi:hypothetical protein
MMGNAQDLTPEFPTGRESRIDWRDSIVAIVLGLLFFGVNENFTLSGDSALYIDYALNAKFDEITVHYGYYRVIWAIDRLIGAPLGIPLHEMVVHMNVVFGALSLAVGLGLARHLIRDRGYAILAVVFFAVNGRMMLNAAMGEIYMLQTLLVLISFLLYVRDRVAWAAFAAGLSLYVSPLSVFAFGFYPTYDLIRWRRFRWNVWLKLIIVGFLTYLPFLVVHGREMLFGIRGLLVIPNISTSNPAELLRNFPQFQFKHYTTLLLLAVPALLSWRRERSLILLMLAVFIPHLYVIAHLTSEDNVFIFNTDFLFCCTLAAGARALATRWSGGRFVWPALLAAHVLLMTLTRTYFSFDNRRNEASELAAVGRKYLEGRSAALITEFNQSVTVPFFARATVRGPLMQDTLWAQMADVSSRADLAPRLRVAEIYVLETWMPSGLSNLFRSDDQIAAIRAQNQWRGWAKRVAGIDCDELVQKGIYELYRCRGSVKPGPLPPMVR